MLKKIYIHRKNYISISYNNKSINIYNYYKYNIKKYNNNEISIKHHKLQHENYKQHSIKYQYNNINIIKEGIYNKNENNTYVYVKLNNILELSEKSSKLYSYIMKNIYINSFDFANRKKKIYNQKIIYMYNTYKKNEILEINKYYIINIKDKIKPIYLQENAILYDKYYNPITMIDIKSKFDKQNILGLDNNHNVKEYEIKKITIEVLNKKENEYYMPFIEMNIDLSFDKLIIIDNIIVNLNNNKNILE